MHEKIKDFVHFHCLEFVAELIHFLIREMEELSHKTNQSSLMSYLVHFPSLGRGALSFAISELLHESASLSHIRS